MAQSELEKAKAERRVAIKAAAAEAVAADIADKLASGGRLQWKSYAPHTTALISAGDTEVVSAPEIEAQLEVPEVEAPEVEAPEVEAPEVEETRPAPKGKKAVSD